MLENKGQEWHGFIYAVDWNSRTRLILALASV
jgi:hypothetical protein